MNTTPFYIITSDATSYILPVTCYLYNKYWNTDGSQRFTILGNHPPEEKLPENFEFVQVKKENNIHKWTKYLYDYILENEKSEQFIVTLDDYLPNQELGADMMEELIAYAKQNGKVGRIELGKLEEDRCEVIQQKNGYELVRIKPDAPYRISCQTSVWNREYFLKYYNHDWTPWELEITGSEMAKNDGWEIIGTKGKTSFDWVSESALSGRWPGMINILGMRPEDVRYCIEQKMIDPQKLQYGIWYEFWLKLPYRFQNFSKRFAKIPKFSEIGYEFKWKIIKPHITKQTFNWLYSHYKNVYPRGEERVK
jgi:hypothetical protein